MLNDFTRLLMASGLAFATTTVSAAETNCNTALSRIAKKKAQDAIQEQRNSACSGLKHINKTRALELRKFELCETGAVVSLTAKVFAKCATSSSALIPAGLSDEVTALVSVDLQSCKVLNVKINANKFITNVGFKSSNIEDQIEEGINKEIRQYCY